MSEQTPLSAREIATSVRADESKAGEVLRRAADALARSDAGPDPVHAFLSVRIDAVGNDSSGSGRLTGVPVAVKDNIVTVDFPTTCGSRILEGYRSPFDATAVARLRAEGAVVIGKTNLDEFGMGSSTEFSAYGPTRNPVDRSRVPGGSSGGSAAAVAAGITPIALGTETGGSVRQPAAFCGVVGIKPTYGRVSRYGLVAYASSLDQVAVVGRSVDDAALGLEVISGHDPLDSTSAVHEPIPLDGAPGPLDGLVVGVPEEYFPDSLNAGIVTSCRAALRQLESLGAEIREVSLPSTRHAIPTYYIIAPAEASSNLARYDGVRYGVRPPDVKSATELYERTRALFGPEVKRRIMLGTYALSAGYYDAYYGQAQRVRGVIIRDFDWVFASGVDVVFTPTTPTTAFRLGERLDDPLEMYLSDAFTVTANLAGIPAISLPIGRVDGLPVGGQFMGPRWSEPVLVRTARALEHALANDPETAAPGKVVAE